MTLTETPYDVVEKWAGRPAMALLGIGYGVLYGSSTGDWLGAMLAGVFAAGIVAFVFVLTVRPFLRGLREGLGDAHPTVVDAIAKERIGARRLAAGAAVLAAVTIGAGLWWAVTTGDVLGGASIALFGFVVIGPTALFVAGALFDR